MPHTFKAAWISVTCLALAACATPQEKAIDPDQFVAELDRRNIKLAKSEPPA